MASKREANGRSAERRQKVDISEAVAARLMRRFLRDPFDERPEPRLDALSPEEQGALGKVLEAVGATLPDLVGSAVVRSRAIATLVDSLEAGPASPARAQDALNRLGTAGRLSLSEYRLEFREIVATFARYGDRQSHIEKTIRSPDLVQHLSATGTQVRSEAEGVSLFVERIVPTRGQPFARVVVCSRQGMLLAEVSSLLAHL